MVYVQFSVEFLEFFWKKLVPASDIIFMGVHIPHIIFDEF